MTTIAIRGLLRRRLRTLLTALAIVLGSAMVCGTLVMGATAQDGFAGWFAKANDGAAVVVTGEQVVQDVDGLTPPPALPAGLVAELRAVPGVAAAGGQVQGTAVIIGRDGDPIGGDGPPQLGSSVPEAGLGGLAVTSGRWPGAGEVAIDVDSAVAQGYRLGDTVRIATQRPAEALRLSGLVDLPGSGTGGATFAVLDLATAQRLLDRAGEVDVVRLRAADGVAPAELADRVRAANLDAGVALRVETADAYADRMLQEQLGWFDVMRSILLGFGVVAVLVGSFVIFNTFSITVAQRVRELALLRALGATRGQVLRSVLGEALALALIGSALGVAAGVALARGLLSLLDGMGLNTPAAPLVLEPGTLLPGFVVGVVATMLAAIVPAVRATRVPPTAALRDVAGARRRPRRRSLVLGLVALAASTAALAVGTLGDPGSTGQRVLLLGGGALGLFLATAALASRLVPYLVAVLGWPLRRLGIAGQLASGGASRHPGRTATTAAALMVGVALASFMAIFAHGMAAGFTKEADDHIAADLRVGTIAWGGSVDQELARRVSEVPGVALVATQGGEITRFAGGGDHVAFGVEPQAYGRAYALDWVEGSAATLAALGPGQALVEETIAREEGLVVGAAFTAIAPSGAEQRLTVAGVYRDAYYAAGYLMRQDAWQAFTGRHDAREVFVVGEPGTDLGALKAGVEGALEPWPGVHAQTHADIRRANEQDAQNVVAIVDAMLALSVLISIVGIVNTLALGVLERTRELGLLRAVGASRRQVRRMIRYEGVLTALIGTTLGIGLGLVLAAMAISAIDGASFSLPLGQLVVTVLVAVVLGVVAAALPARRAQRLDPVQAIAFGT